jgi:hypothetical protein
MTSSHPVRGSRVCVVLLGLALGPLTTPAAATATRVCNLVTDARGDAAVVPGVPDPADLVAAPLDIVSADIASNARHVTVAIRVADLGQAALLAAQPGAPAGEGRMYSFRFDVEGVTWLFSAALDSAAPPSAVYGSASIGRSLGGSDAFGNGWGSGFSNDASVPASVVVDAPHDQLRITITQKQARELGKLPSRIGPFVVTSYRSGRAAPVNTGYQHDYARGSRFYRLGQASCVPIGR